MTALYGPDDLLHEAGPQHDWQESVVLIFHDPASGLAGFLRAGSEPNQQLSQPYVSFVTRDGLRYRHHPFDTPMQPGDRTADGFASGPVTWRIPRGEYVHVTATTPDVRADLRLYDWFVSQPWQMFGPGGLAQLAPGHLESSGHVEGVVEIGGRRFEIKDGLGHRDHSWGTRDVRVMRNFRWVAGTCGPQLSFSGICVHLANGAFMRGGWIHQGGVVRKVSSFDVVAQINVDGVSTRGGYAEWGLAEGGTVRVDAEVVDGIVTSYRSDHGGPGSHVGVEGMAVARQGDLTGFCDFNVSNNLCGGEQAAPSVCEAWATFHNGLSRRPVR
jgi:hypothetical protein